MKTKEEIQKEYEVFDPFTKLITTLEIFQIYIITGIDGVEELKKDFKKELRENFWWQLEGKIRNFFNFIFEEEEVELYEEDNAFLYQGLALLETYKDYYEKIYSIATEENYQELLKLTDFACKYYNEYIDYLDRKRELLEMKYKGITCIDYSLQDNRESFDEFFQEKINEFTNFKAVEKTKKI